MYIVISATHFNSFLASPSSRRCQPLSLHSLSIHHIIASSTHIHALCSQSQSVRDQNHNFAAALMLMSFPPSRRESSNWKHIFLMFFPTVIPLELLFTKNYIWCIYSSDEIEPRGREASWRGRCRPTSSCSHQHDWLHSLSLGWIWCRISLKNI